MNVAVVYCQQRPDGTLGWLFYVGARDCPLAEGGTYDSPDEAALIASFFASKVIIEEQADDA